MDGWMETAAVERELRTRGRGGSTSLWLGVVSEEPRRDEVFFRESLSAGSSLPARQCMGNSWEGKMLACVCSGASSARIGNGLSACVRVGKVRDGHLYPHLGSKSDSSG